jgi:hypothetical protein
LTRNRPLGSKPPPLEHISKCFGLMRVLELPFNLRTTYRLLSDKTQLQEAITLLAQRPDAFNHLALVKHFEVFYLNLKREGQSEGEIATIANFLAPYQHPGPDDTAGCPRCSLYNA